MWVCLLAEYWVSIRRKSVASISPHEYARSKQLFKTKISEVLFKRMTSKTARPVYHIDVVQRWRTCTLIDVKTCWKNHTFSLWEERAESVGAERGIACSTLKVGSKSAPCGICYRNPSIPTFQRRPSHTSQHANSTPLDSISRSLSNALYFCCDRRCSLHFLYLLHNVYVARSAD